MSRFDLTGKKALVTGGSRGLGLTFAKALAAAGADVAITSRTLDSLNGPRQEIEGLGRRAVGLALDVRDHASIVAAVDGAHAALGAIDILVNNAAQGPYRPFEKFSERDFRMTLDANMLAPLELAQLAAPDMRKKRRGWILNISSATAEPPEGPPYIPWQAKGGSQLYAASKAGLNRLTQGIAAELAADGIAVNTLAPVQAVITPGVTLVGADKWIEPSMIEPVEAMAEAALALCSCDPEKLTGRVTYSLHLLKELGREIRTLDGREVYRA